MPSGGSATRAPSPPLYVGPLPEFTRQLDATVREWFRVFSAIMTDHQVKRVQVILTAHGNRVRTGTGKNANFLRLTDLATSACVSPDLARSTISRYMSCGIAAAIFIGERTAARAELEAIAEQHSPKSPGVLVFLPADLQEKMIILGGAAWLRAALQRG